MIEREIDVTTPEGSMKTFIFHPEHDIARDGPFPVVLYLMDAPSIRPALKDMASRLASAGYYVMLPYLFYRGGPFPGNGSTRSCVAICSSTPASEPPDVRYSKPPAITRSAIRSSL